MIRFKKMAAVLAVMLAVVFTTGMFSGCQKRSGLKILMLVNDGSDIYYSEKFKALSEELGIDIDYVGYAFQDYDMQLRLAMQDDIPDIFYVRPNQIKNFVADGLLADIAPYIEENVDSSVLLDSFNTPFRYDGTNVGAQTGAIYAVNGGFSYQGVAYNKVLLNRCADMIHQAGLKLPHELPDGKTYTWDEFAQVLAIVDGMAVGGASGTDKIGGMDMPNGGMLLQVIMNFGGDVLDGRTVTVNTPEVKAGLQFLYNAHTSKPNTTGYISADYGFPQWKGQLLAFYSASGSWEMAPYGEYDDVTTGALQDVNVNFMPWPTVDGNYNSSRHLIGGAGYAVAASSRNLEMAKKVATHFMKAEVLDDLCYRGMALPMTKSLAAGDYLIDPNFHPDNKQLLIDIISGKIGETSPLNNCYSTEWFDVFYGGMDKVWNGTSTIADYLSSMQGSMQTLYNKYN